MTVPVVALLFSAFALVLALLSIALALRQPSTQGSLAKGPIPLESTDMAVASSRGAWAGNSREGYRRGDFTVTRMPTLGLEWRGTETEWVAYRDGKRLTASPDLAEVLAWCEKEGA